MTYDFEIWKPIDGYEGIYEIRNDGLLHCLPRKHRRIEYSYGRNCYGYLQFTLSKNGIETCKKAHILVYETFVGPIPKGYDVHHKNQIKTDNRIENLELIEHIEHSKLHKEKRIKNCIKSNSIPIVQYTKDGEFVAEYESAKKANEITNINPSHIRSCCNGKRKTAGGFIWKNKKAA